MSDTITRKSAAEIEAGRNAALDAIKGAGNTFFHSDKDNAASVDYVDSLERALNSLQAADWEAATYMERWSAAKCSAAIGYCVNAAREISDYLTLAGVNGRPVCPRPRAFMMIQSALLTAAAEWADEIIEFAD